MYCVLYNMYVYDGMEIYLDKVCSLDVVLDFLNKVKIVILK